jgi:hypothetical protein
MLCRVPEQPDGHQRMRALDQIGARQLGLVTSHQLDRIGFGRAAREAAVVSLRLHRVRKGVYRLPGAVPTWESAVLAAVLAAGPEAVASHMSAAHLWSLFDGRPPTGVDDAIHVIAPGQHRLAGVRFHRQSLDDAERTRHRSVPVTTPARTLLDLGGMLGADQLGRCTDEALRRRLLTLDELRRVFERHSGSGRRRLAPLRAVLADRAPGFDPGANAWEVRMDQLWDQLGLPPAVRQYTIRVGGHRYRVDRAIPELKLAVEWVGKEFHSLSGRFVRDRLRISDLVQAGWDVVEVTPEWTPRRIRDTVMAKVAARRVMVSRSGAGQPSAARYNARV